MRISDFHTDQKAELRHKITQGDLFKFVDLTSDDNPIHVDLVFAGNIFFKKPVVHGMFGASFISTIIGTKLPGKGALWFARNLEFLLPFRIGDELSIIAEVLKIDKQQQILELSTNYFNQHKKKVVSGTTKVQQYEIRRFKITDLWFEEFFTNTKIRRVAI